MTALQQPSRQRPAEAPPLSLVKRLVADDLAAVNSLILERLQSEVTLIPELARHLIAAGGKRVRPTLTLLAARLCGYEGDRHIALATSVEFIHTATLLHDDVVDESDLRRGRSTANALWGNKAPVLVGDFLFSRAFQLMVADGNIRVLDILANASAVIAEGEVAQLLTAGDVQTTEAAYYDVIRAKTAALFQAACRIGAVVADRPAVEEEALATFGDELGIAFQLVDDALDYSAREAQLGKTIGDDFREGKASLPVLLAYAAGNPAERAFWERVIGEPAGQREDDLAEAQLLLARHGTLDATLAQARASGQRARGCLEVFERSPWRDALEEIVDFSIARAY
ncbi:MAG: polyprenyl synthetase family protein [Geminicoccaceae bacterium]|nr:polyprenyl synthetase family protein [Geminicoccaceae bacterium]MCB9966633.1 polyprenyl synthetase family protein [Geminicoccaceae bacterium]